MAELEASRFVGPPTARRESSEKEVVIALLFPQSHCWDIGWRLSIRSLNRGFTFFLPRHASFNQTSIISASSDNSHRNIPVKATRAASGHRNRAEAVMLTERELQISPIVQESVMHNTKVRLIYSF
jgi:hypothetical protein